MPTSWRLQDIAVIYFSATHGRSAVGGELTTEDTESTEKKPGFCIMLFMKMIEPVS